LLLLPAVFLIEPGSADGGGQERYTLKDCIQTALENSAAAANARRDQQIAGLRAVQTRSETMPQVSLAGSYTRLDEVQEIEFEGDPVELGSLDNYSVQANVNQLLYSGGRMNAALRAAALNESYAEWVRADTESRLVRDVRVGFADILLARERVRVLEGSLAQLESVVQQTEQKLRSGTASEFDLITAKVRMANERPVLIGAQNACSIAVEKLTRLLNLDDNDVVFEGALVHAPVAANLQDLQWAALHTRPSIRGAEAGVELREQDVRAAHSGWLPELKAFFSYNGANSYGFVSFDDQWGWHWSTGVNLDWNLWDGALTRALVHEKRLELQKSRTDLEDLREEVKLEVKTAFLEMQYALESIEAGQGNVSQAERALAIAKARHGSGMGTYLEFVDANVGLNRAQLTCLRATHDHMNAVSRLLYAAGVSEEEIYGEKEE